MQVWLTIKDQEGREASPEVFQYVEGEGPDYSSALEAARAAVPSGSVVISIRTSNTSKDPRTGS
ncbi:hypothetical protein [Arthrobacter woluwensis]|uniref:Uncharacterized protein n=1 Tax=Arthrobacter woluwensis TaxID=156980 RepID=A0A1H4I691_9MICC|nr:hypothetical protein [Arthrobacter woluwensis]SEB29614.1 hypothetical protein SAMN04489745_0065 [Arthrobacter woluwensis]